MFLIALKVKCQLFRSRKVNSQGPKGWKSEFEWCANKLKSLAWNLHKIFCQILANSMTIGVSQAKKRILQIKATKRKNAHLIVILFKVNNSISSKIKLDNLAYNVPIFNEKSNRTHKKIFTLLIGRRICPCPSHPAGSGLCISRLWKSRKMHLFWPIVPI